jgi:hypothetical protein
MNKENKVRCNNCMWEGYEDDLHLFETKGDGTDTVTAEESSTGLVQRFSPKPDDPFYFKGCPNCKSDDWLMDID